MIPRTLAQNCGSNIIRLLTSLRAKHATGDTMCGVNGETGQLADMNELRIWEPLSVKQQVYKTAVEVSDTSTELMLSCAMSIRNCSEVCEATRGK